MNRSRPYSFLFILALVMLIAGVTWFGAREARMSRANPEGGPGVSVVGWGAPTSRNTSTSATTAVLAKAESRASAAEAPPPARFMFDALIEGRVPVRKETRMFQAQKWEPDLAKALGLPPGTPLQRRSAIYHVPELKYSHVRVDRIYRMDKNVTLRSTGVTSQTTSSAGGTPATHTAGTALLSSASNSASSTENGTRSNQQTLTGSATLDAPGGELLWDNAMIADHLMVQAQSGVSRTQFLSSLPAGCLIKSAIDAAKGLYLVAVPSDGEDSLERAMLALNHESLKHTIWFAEPDFLMSGADTTPDDPLFTTSITDITKQWFLPKIAAPLGWDVVRQPTAAGSLDADTVAKRTIVAVVDTGVDYTHPDLAPNMYANPGESGEGKETNGVDDDANGKIDDYRGWNFVDNNNAPMDDVGHGTHVAGIIGAVGNNATGATGVCWGVKILPLRIIKKVSTGTYGTYSDAVSALVYIRTLNSGTSSTRPRVAVANHSWGGRGYSLPLLNAINNPTQASDPLPSGLTASYASDTNMFMAMGSEVEVAKIKVGMTISGPGIPTGTLVVMMSNGCITLSDYTTQPAVNQALTFSSPVNPKAYGALHVAAAGNSRYNNDRFPTYPASLPSGFVVSVGATDANDDVAVWAGGAGSNYGLLTVDLFAPGSSIRSTKWKAPGDLVYDYEPRNGTSMAAPQVSGAVALLRMWQPTLTESQAKLIVIEQVDRLPQLETKCLSRGRLNVAKALDRLFQPNLQGSGGSTGGTGLSAEALSVGQGLTGQAAKGNNHTLVVRSGKVYAWGSNKYGQMGPNGPTSTSSAWPPVASATPLEVTGLDDVIMVAAGSNTSYALKNDGTVWAWGSNRNGALGNGSTNPNDSASYPVPQQVMGLWDGATPQPNAIWISASTSDSQPFVLVANGDGQVWSWGLNGFGQLGVGTYVNHSSPVKVSGINTAVMVAAGTSSAAGRAYSLALKRDGTVMHWGRNPFARPALDPDNLTTPASVAGISDIAHISTSGWTTYAINESGDVWWWGRYEGSESNPNYNLGASVPTLHPGLSRMVYIATGSWLQSLGVDADGRLWAWGDNDVGQLGISSMVPNADPALVNLNTTEGVGAIATSGLSGVVILGSGEVLTWGQNAFGELGGGGMDSSNLPVRIPNLSNINKVTNGAYYPFARTQSGEWFHWGPYRVVTMPEALSLPESYASEILASPVGVLDEVKNTAGSLYSANLMVGRKSDGTMWTWGSNLRAEEIGSSTIPSNNIGVFLPLASAVRVDNVNSAVHFATSHGRIFEVSMAGLTGSLFSLAVESTGVVKAWGNNAYGQLGDGTTTSRGTAIQSSGLTGVIEVAAGAGHSLALKSDGTVWAWGHNGYGQLGDGTQVNRTQPVRITGISGVAHIVAGMASSMAVKTDGSVWVWGRKDDGLLAPLGTLAQNQVLPANVPGLPPVSRACIVFEPQPFVSGTYTIDDQQTVICLATNGRVWAWSRRSNAVGRFLTAPTPPSTPAEVEALSNVVQIGAGPRCAFAVKSDGSVWTWGSNTLTGMGTGSNMNGTPALVVGFGGASQTLSTLGTGSELDSWYLDYFSASELLSSSLVADDGDPDGDGIANLMEYALGLDPRQQDLDGLPSLGQDLVAPSAQSEDASLSQVALFSVPTADLTSGKRYMKLTVLRMGGIRQDIDYFVEVSNDLMNWRSGDPHTVTVLDTAEILEVYSATSMDDVPKQFMRLRVQRREGFCCD